MNVLDIWGPALTGPIAGVVAAAAFTWFFNFRAARDHKRGVMALVAQELLHNDAALRTLIGALNHVLQDGPPALVARRFLATAPSSPHWQRSRWDLPDVGTAFTPDELTRYSEWYFGLDTVTFRYEGLIGQLQQMDLYDGPMTELEMRRRFSREAELKEQIDRLLEYAEQLCKNRPPILDSRLGSVQHLRWLVRETKSDDSATAAATDAALQSQESGPGDVTAQSK